MTARRSAAGSRGSALWGSGHRGGERSRGARRCAAATLAVAFALAAPLAASAGSGNPKPGAQGTYVPQALLQQAQAHGNQKVRVIIQAAAGTNAAATAFSRNGAADGGALAKRLSLVSGVAVELKAKWLLRLAKVPGLSITPDAPVESAGTMRYNTQLWPYVSGDARLWGSQAQPAPDAPTIAIVDSGLDASLPDFGDRAYPEVNLSSLSPGANGDDYGHGTFVAGIAADGLPGYTGASPGSHVLPIRVTDDQGTARTSDVIAAAQWILANKDTYDIRVANFSLHSSIETHFFADPLDQAVEKLWFDGIVVVASAGNYGAPDAPSGVLYSPGNDPFVVTVGAVDLGSSADVSDDTVAPWSAWGATEDGFSKPDLGAPGRYMVGPVPGDSTLAQQRADHIVAPGYMELSGTSFAAPVVSGAAAQILALHPDWTPDEVKGALLQTARPTPANTAGQIGTGELRASRAAFVDSPPNGNAPLDQFVDADATGNLSFDAAGWVAAVEAGTWSDASWSDASWSDASWSDASWSDASWSDASWSDVASWSDAAESEPVGPVPTMSLWALGVLQGDPDVALPPMSDTVASLGINVRPSGIGFGH